MNVRAGDGHGELMAAEMFFPALCLRAAMTAIKLIITNALRLVTVSVVGDMLLWLGKITVAAAAGLAAFGMSELPYYTDGVKYPTTVLSSPVFPVAISILVAYVVAQIFFSLYEMAIDTVMLAFCEDCDMHGGNPKWAPPLLMEAMGQEERAAPTGSDASPSKATKANAIAPVAN